MGKANSIFQMGLFMKEISKMESSMELGCAPSRMALSMKVNIRKE